jgi:hypothetical protein
VGCIFLRLVLVIVVCIEVWNKLLKILVMFVPVKNGSHLVSWYVLGSGNKFSNTVQDLQTADKRIVICDVQGSQVVPVGERDGANEHLYTE